jgi:predicted nucleotidyltransferase component of viral defense system
LRREVSNIAQSVHDRLLNDARQTGRPFNELLQYYAMERFLYRLSVSPHRDRFVLKGGLMLLVWDAPTTRPTRDIDLLGRVTTPSEIEAAIADMCSQKVEDDGIVFDGGSLQGQEISGQAEYSGVRVRFDGYLGTARVRMQIDVGVGDVVTPPEKKVTYPVLLDFAAPLLKAYPKETVVAEKLEAMVRLGEINSRMQDFFDLWLMARQFPFDGGVLSSAIERTFANRGTEITPRPTCLGPDFAGSSSKQTQWSAFVRRNRLEVVPQEFEPVVQAIGVFLHPLLASLSADEAVEVQWPPGGPWG